MTKPSFEKLTDTDSIEECSVRAVRNATMMHKALGIPIVVQRDDKMVTVPPDQIEIPELSSEETHEPNVWHVGPGPIGRPTELKPTRMKWPSADEIVEYASMGVRNAMRMHKRLGIPIVVADDDGKPKTIPPEEIEIDGDWE